MSFLHQGEFLKPDQLDQITNTLDSLYSHWTRRAPAPLPIYTLGAATYLDARQSNNSYQALARVQNLLLKQHFEWVYTRLVAEVSLHFGPAVLEEALASPGFHIFGNTKDKPLSPALCRVLESTPASVHVDTPYKNHLTHWMRYAEVDFLHPLSITVCIELPQHGGGLHVWQQLDHVTHFHGHPMVDDRFNRQQLPRPVYQPYTHGWLYVSTGHHVHQIASGKSFLPKDRRITLQAHAVRCDGLWRVFF